MTPATFDRTVTRYLRDIRRIPLLTQAEEAALARRWREHGDHDAMQRLVTSHLRLVVKMARQYRGCSRPLEELIAEGNAGILEAARRFDPDLGVRFATYAIYWIRAAIMEYILQSWSVVKMGTTTREKKLFFNLRRLKGRFQATEEGALPGEIVKKIAVELDVPEAYVAKMQYRLTAPDCSLNAPSGNTDGGDGGEWLELLPDDRPNQEIQLAERAELRHRQKLLCRALNQLTQRERQMIIGRYLSDEPVTRDELSLRFAVSCKRVGQVERGAMQKIRRMVSTKTHPAARSDAG